MRVVWSVKGGVGTTVISAVSAVQRSEKTDVRLVDLAGDLPAALGVAESGREGIGDWMASRADVDTIDHLALPVTDRLDLVPRGLITRDGDHLTRLEHFAISTKSMSREIIVDAGTDHTVLSRLLPHSDESWLVLRPCYLALRRAVNTNLRVDGVVLVNEPGRALSGRDVSSVLNAPIIAEVDLDSRLSRVVDAGLLATRIPSSMNPLQRVA